MSSNIAKIAFRFLVAFVLLYIIVAKVDLDAVFGSIKNISAVSILAVLSLNFLAIFIGVTKWYILLPNYSYRKLLTTSLAGRFYSFVLSGQLVGEVVKTFHLAKGTKDGERVAASVIVDKITGMMGMLILGLFGLFFTNGKIQPQFLYVLTLATLFLIIILYSLKFDLFYNSIDKLINYIVNKYSFLRRFIGISNLLKTWRSYLNRPIVIFKSLMLGILFQLTGAVFTFIFSNALNISLGLIDYCWINAILMLAMILPITVGGLGVREGVFVGIFGWLGISADKALALSLCLFSLQLFDATIGGIVFSNRIFKTKYLKA